MGASDYMVGNAPAGASYAAPLVGQQLGQTIANLPQAYYEGQVRRHDLAMMHAFDGGLPTDENGNPDVNQMMKRVAQIPGSGQYIMKDLLPYLMQRSNAAYFDRQLQGGDTHTSSGGQGNTAAGPANVTQRPTQNIPPAPQVQAGPGGGPPQAPPQAQQQPSQQPTQVASADPTQAVPAPGQGQGTTLTQMVQRMSGGKGAQSIAQAVGTAANTLQLDPDKPLSPRDTMRAYGFLTRNMGLQPVNDMPPRPPAQDQAAAQAPAPQQQAQAQTQPQSPLTAGEGKALPGPQAPTPIKPFQPPPPTQRMQELQTGIQNAERLAAWAGATGNKAGQEVALEKAKRLSEELAAEQKANNEAATETYKRTQLPTEAHINANDVSQENSEARKEQAKLDRAHFSKVEDSLGGQAQAANKMLHMTDLADALMRDPNFVSGKGAAVNMAWKQWLAQFSPKYANAPLSQEAFHKVVAASLMTQIEQLKTELSAFGGSGRIFQAEIEMMKNAANSSDYSPAANRLLVEISRRAAQHVIALNNEALKYGPLDRAFAQKMQTFHDDHPMFTPDELQDTRRIAPQHFNTASEARAAKLTPDTPIRVGTDPDIQYLHPRQ